MSETILKLPCREKIFVIKTNASATGVGAALTQPYIKGSMLVSYASHTLKVQKRRYLTTK